MSEKEVIERLEQEGYRTVMAESAVAMAARGPVR